MNPLEEDEEAWPDEPEEFDPDSIGPDAPDTTPTLRESLGATEAIPDELFRAFWASVLFLNVALAALSLGALFIYFRGDYETGVPALFIGAVAALATVRYYWRGKSCRYSGAETSGGDTSEREGADGTKTAEGSR